MFSGLIEFGSLCLATASKQAPTLLGLFLVGLAGSLTHCVGMCGPFALSQTGSRITKYNKHNEFTAFSRVKSACLIPYHLGRLTTYSLFGALLSAPIGAVIRNGGLWWLSPLMLALAAIVFVAIALGRFHAPQGMAKTGQRFGAILAGIGRPLFADPIGIKGYCLGLLLGLLPCGLVASALIGATAQGDPILAAIGMAAFGLGTIPALFAVAYGGAWFLPRLGIDLRKLAPYLALGNGVFLLALAARAALSA